MMETKKDRDLILETLCGDENSTTQLFRRYFDDLFGYIYFRINKNYADAEDLVQDIFTDTWENLDQFDIESNFWFWLCGIAKRRLSKYYRKNKLRRSELLYESLENELNLILDNLELRTPIPPAVFENEEIGQVLSLSLSAISPRHRHFLSAKYLEGKSSQKIASELKISADAVDATLQRARAALKSALQGKFERA